MVSQKQSQFRRRVKVWLAHRDETVTALAARLGKRRDTVSGAIHTEKFPRVRELIEKAISQ